MMAAARFSRARESTGPAARVWTSVHPGATGTFRVHNEPSQPAPRAPERGRSQ
jgi:hypothetical protein